MNEENPVPDVAVNDALASDAPLPLSDSKERTALPVELYR
jgi:hypothetical protein